MQDNLAKKKIGKILRAARDRAELGVRELARQANVSPAMISRVESGDCRLGLEVLGKLSYVLPFTDDDHNQLASLGFQVSSEMRSASIVFANPPYAKLGIVESSCRAWLRLLGPHVGVNEKDFVQVRIPENECKQYDLLIQVTDQSWVGIEFKKNEVWVARSKTDAPNDLPTTTRRSFRENGGVILKLVEEKG